VLYLLRELYDQLRNLSEVVQYISNKTGHHIAIYGDPGKMEDMAHFSIEGMTADTCVFPFKGRDTVRAFNMDPDTGMAQQDLLVQILRINSIKMD
jgi:hypothetical protein